MTPPRLGCIADDYTGATDLSSMLVRRGLRVIQCFGVPKDPSIVADADVVVVALKSRSLPAADAVSISLEALAFLKRRGVQRFFFKYCSTFDSTPAGNIGPVADALAGALQVNELIFCPSFPENGRTVYCGHLFVHGVPLHETGMRHHPLNPMTDSNLVRVLQAQSARPVGLLSIDEKDRNTTRQEDPLIARHLIADAISDEDLDRVARLAADDTLLTGGSAIGAAWARLLISDADAASPTLKPPAPTSPPKQATEEAVVPRFIILAGSCSDATREQIRSFAQDGPCHHLNVAEADADDRIARIALSAVDWCRQQVPHDAALICSAANPNDIVRSGDENLDSTTAKFTESVFADIAEQLVAAGARRLIIAGGETAGAIINALKIDAITIGQEIAPGVPWVHSIGEPRISLALKSGNFGGAHFFRDAIEVAS